MAKCAPGLAVVLFLALLSPSMADDVAWMGKTVIPRYSTESECSAQSNEVPALPDEPPTVSAPQLYLVVNEFGDNIDVCLIGTDNSPATTQRETFDKCKFILVDRAATYFTARLVADPMDAFALRNLAAVEQYFGEVERANMDYENAALLHDDLLNPNPGRSRRKWTLWVHDRVIPRQNYAVPASERLDLLSQFHSKNEACPATAGPPMPVAPAAPATSGSPILVRPVTPGPPTQ
jgi:hypothetical protein